MKKMLALLLAVVAVGLVFREWNRDDQRDLASVGSEAGAGADAGAEPGSEAGPGSGAGSGTAAGSDAGAGARGNDQLDSRSSAPVRPSAEKFVEYKGMFAEAPVISTMMEYGPEPGQETATRIVETQMKQPFVKIREIYEERNGARVLVEQQAMVANQLMLQRPEGVAEATFFDALRSAGAKELKPAGDAVVATFESRPHDPKALEDYLARVRELVGAEVTVEYNYIRRLI